MEETTIREPEQICQGCTKKLLKVVRGPKLRAVLGYFVREVWTMPAIADLRLTSEGGIVARIEGEKDFRVDLGGRKGLIRSIHSIATKAALDGDELGTCSPRLPRSSERSTRSHEMVVFGNPALSWCIGIAGLLTRQVWGRGGLDSNLRSAGFTFARSILSRSLLPIRVRHASWRGRSPSTTCKLVHIYIYSCRRRGRVWRPLPPLCWAWSSGRWQSGSPVFPVVSGRAGVACMHTPREVEYAFS